MKTIVELKSDLYGSETFEYQTKKEAKEGFFRLVESINKQFAIDKVERTLTMPGAIVQWHSKKQEAPMMGMSY